MNVTLTEISFNLWKTQRQINMSFKMCRPWNEVALRGRLFHLSSRACAVKEIWRDIEPRDFSALPQQYAWITINVTGNTAMNLRVP
jgi:hypothetical protein